MVKPNPDRETFTYGVSIKLVLLATLLFAVFCVAALVRAAHEYRDGDWVYFAVSIPVVSVFLTASVLASRDVVISSEGIGRSLFGVTLGFIRWEKVVAVRCGDVPSGRGAYTRYYSARSSVANPFSAVIFRASIEGFDRLVERLNGEVLSRGIPVSTRRNGVLRAIDHLPKPTEELGKLT